MNSLSASLSFLKPRRSSYDEFTKGGPERISDRKARDVAEKNLQIMIKSWLEENYPDMPPKERKLRAKAMDISLIEEKKEASMKTFYELNSGTCEDERGNVFNLVLDNLTIFRGLVFQ